MVYIIFVNQICAMFNLKKYLTGNFFFQIMIKFQIIMFIIAIKFNFLFNTFDLYHLKN